MTASTAPLFRDQAMIFMTQVSTRRNPLSPETIRSYSQRLSNDILPLIGHLSLDVIDNVRVRAMVDEWVLEEISPGTMRLNFNLIKQILRSAVDEKGQPKYPLIWNSKFIEFPKWRPKKALVNAQGIQDGISKLLKGECRECAVLVAVLAGTGLRIGEALAVRLEPKTGEGAQVLAEESVWIPAESKILVRLQRSRYKDPLRAPKFKQGKVFFREPKSVAGIREIDLAPELNNFMLRVFSKLEQGARLFPQSRSFYDQRIKKVLPGGFHTFRRFRITHLSGKSCPDSLSRYWAGHAGGEVHEGYEQFENEIQTRKTEAARIGLGFVLPEVS